MPATCDATFADWKGVTTPFAWTVYGTSTLFTVVTTTGTGGRFRCCFSLEQPARATSASPPANAPRSGREFKAKVLGIECRFIGVPPWSPPKEESMVHHAVRSRRRHARAAPATRT